MRPGGRINDEVMGDSAVVVRRNVRKCNVSTRDDILSICFISSIKAIVKLVDGIESSN